MREFKYRGFHKCTEEDAKSIFGIKELSEVLCNGLRTKGIWLYGNLMFDGSLPYIVGNFTEVDDEVASPEWWGAVIPETVGQFASMTDNSGNKIFEGDIVKGHFYYGFPCERHRLIGVVKFISPTFEICGVKQYEGERQPLNALYKVIGNVYDNPELIETKNREEEPIKNHCICCGKELDDNFHKVCDDCASKTKF